MSDDATEVIKPEDLPPHNINCNGCILRAFHIKQLFNIVNKITSNAKEAELAQKEVMQILVELLNTINEMDFAKEDIDKLQENYNNSQQDLANLRNDIMAHNKYSELLKKDLDDAKEWVIQKKEEEKAEIICRKERRRLWKIALAISSIVGPAIGWLVSSNWHKIQKAINTLMS